MQEAGFWVALWLLANVIGVGIFDIAALFSAGRVATVTTHLISWSRAYPFVPFSVGLIMGHLFFPAFTWMNPP